MEVSPIPYHQFITIIPLIPYHHHYHHSTHFISRTNQMIQKQKKKKIDALEQKCSKSQHCFTTSPLNY